MVKESAIFDTGHFAKSDFDLFYFDKFDKASFANVLDRALFDVAHFDEAEFDATTTTSTPRFDYVRFNVTNTIFESFKKEVSKSLT